MNIQPRLQRKQKNKEKLRGQTGDKWKIKESC